jgi:hypothetical protein
MNSSNNDKDAAGVKEIHVADPLAEPFSCGKFAPSNNKQLKGIYIRGPSRHAAFRSFAFFGTEPAFSGSNDDTPKHVLSQQYGQTCHYLQRARKFVP